MSQNPSIDYFLKNYPCIDKFYQEDWHKDIFEEYILYNRDPDLLTTVLVFNPTLIHQKQLSQIGLSKKVIQNIKYITELFNQNKKNIKHIDHYIILIFLLNIKYL